MTNPTRLRPILLSIACLFGVAAAAKLIVQDAPFDARSADAAPPHILSTTEHPYDPDWLIVRWVLRRKCLSCHRPGTKRYDLTTYDALSKAGVEDGMPLVVPFKPDESALLDYVDWNVHARPNSDSPDQPMMPSDQREWLTAGQLDAIRRWITNGALEYRLPPGCSPRPLLEIDFPSAKECAGCHPSQYREWSMSMHAYAQHSPIFERFNLTLVERTGGTIGTFCTRCHTPIGTALGENESVRNANRSRISTEGVTCIVCHRRRDGRYKASGRVAFSPGGVLEGCVYGPFDANHDVLAESNAHPAQRNDYIRSSQFCGECHDVTNPVGIRLEEAFSEWHNSPAAKKGITCQACHMGPVQGRAFAEWERPLGPAAVVPGIDPSRMPLRRLSSHIMAGPDYSMLPDTEFPEKLDWMYETDYRVPGNLTPHQQRTLHKLRLSNRELLNEAMGRRLELLQNSLRLHVGHPVSAEPGGKLPIKVQIESITSGHSVPTGFTAERQVWVSVDVINPHGQFVYRSGDFDSNGDLRDDHSHEVLTGKAHFDPRLFNLQNKFIALSQKGTERSVVLSVNRFVRPVNVLRPATGAYASFGRPPGFRIAKGSLPPLKKKHQNYPVRMPSLCGEYRLIVRLNFRHLPPSLLDAIGASELKHLLETVVIDEYSAPIRVGGFTPVNFR